MHFLFIIETSQIWGQVNYKENLYFPSEVAVADFKNWEGKLIFNLRYFVCLTNLFKKIYFRLRFGLENVINDY